MRNYIEVPQDYAAHVAGKMVVYRHVNGGRWFVAIAERELHTDELLLRDAPEVEMDEANLVINNQG